MTSAEKTSGSGAEAATASAPGEEAALNSKWLLSESQLHECRTRANQEGVRYLQKLVAFQTSAGAGDGAKDEKAESKPEPSVKWFASGYAQRCLDGDSNDMEEDQDDEDQNSNPISDLPNPPLTPEEELLLLQFYSGKIPDLIGPAAVLSRLRRDVKVTATASALFRRFYLSNSVMTHDPKSMMVASAFLASKVEDATVDIRYLEEATKQMQAPVTQSEIIDAEIALVSGVHFELLCFHPYKTVLAYTEDLRTYLKTDQGKALAAFPPGNEDRPIVGEDLRPMHDEARGVVDDACVSDVILLASPGQIGLAAMVVANEDLQAEEEKRGQAKTGGKEESQRPVVPNIDLLGYLDSRFADQGDEKARQELRSRISETCDMLRALREGKYGCGNHGIDMVKLKEVHKKWKKCRGGAEKTKKKKKKKRKAEEGGADESEAKKAKTSA